MMKKSILAACFFLLQFIAAGSAFSQQLTAGEGAYESTCGGLVEYIASSPALLGAACVLVQNNAPVQTGGVASKIVLGSCSTSSCSTTYVDPTYSNCLAVFAGVGYDPASAAIECGNYQTGSPAVYFSISIVTSPVGANCPSGSYDVVNGACLGGKMSCSSGLPQSFSFLECTAGNVLNRGPDATCVAGSSPPAENWPPPSWVAYDGCEYQAVAPIAPTNIWEDSTTGNMFMDIPYITDGLVATASDPVPPVTGVAFASSCQLNPTAINCGGAGPNAPTDGTSGGTGTTTCGTAIGQPACANGAATGTTACGGTAQPSCTASSGTGSGSTCGGPGQPVCQTNAAPVCGGPGLPACASTDQTADSALTWLANFFGTAAAPSADPVPASVNDLKSAGMDGGSTFKGLTSWTMPSHSSVCPSGTINLFGKALAYDGGCMFAQQNLGGLRSIMILCFTLLAMFIVLRA